MHAVDFIQDLATIMIIAAAVTILFHRLKQPVVLGYIVAGVIIGPHTPPFELIHDSETIRTLAELGVVFLMFSLGLEFSLRKLARVGPTAFIAALAEIVSMIWIGYEIGRFFSWKTMDALFLGAMLAISSTTIIVKALDGLGMKKERFAQLIFGILVVEDVLAISIMALLSGIAISGSVVPREVALTVGGVALFIVVSMVIGILVVPRLLAYVARFHSHEMLLITVLGLCFGFCLIVVRFEYSIALGAFLIGAVMAESRQLHTIERLVEPLRDMFSAIFFVTIGLMLDPKVLVRYFVPIAVITVAVVIGKVLTCSLGTFLAGNDGRTSLRVGMGLAQIGEFSFIIASLGLTLKVTSDFLYPIAVAVSVVTTLLTPYMIKLADPLAARLAAALPERVTRPFALYTAWLQTRRPRGQRIVIGKIVRKILLQVFVNFALVAAIFLVAAYFAPVVGERLLARIGAERFQEALVWGGALVVSLPFLIATYRKLKALSLLLAELSTGTSEGSGSPSVRRIVSEVIPAASIAGMLLFVSALSASILPPVDLLVLVLLVAAGLTVLLWRWFIRFHARLQMALMDTLAGQEGQGKEVR
jgi:CPA2 family monovalent cation:H+ antiporter-2